MELALRRVYLVESFAHEGQRALHLTRLRMRGAEDPPSPLDYVMQDSLGFEQVVACVEIKIGCRRRARIDVDSNTGRRG